MYTFKKHYLCHRFTKRSHMKRILTVFFLIIFTLTAKAQRPDLPGQLLFDFGFNSWSNNPTGSSLSWFESKTVNMAYYYDLPIGNGGWTITPGIGMSWEKYSFSNNTTMVSQIVDDQRFIRVVDLNEQFGDNLDFDKSKLGINYIDLPLEIRWYAKRNQYSKGFRVGVGGKVSYRYSSFTKLKFEDPLQDPRMLKDRQNIGLDRWRYGLQLRIGWGGIGVFAFYELSDKFSNPPLGGVDTSTFTWGLSLTGF